MNLKSIRQGIRRRSGKAKRWWVFHNRVTARMMMEFLDTVNVHPEDVKIFTGRSRLLVIQERVS